MKPRSSPGPIRIMSVEFVKWKFWSGARIGHSASTGPPSPKSKRSPKDNNRSFAGDSADHFAFESAGLSDRKFRINRILEYGKSNDDIIFPGIAIAVNTRTENLLIRWLQSLNGKRRNRWLKFFR